MLTITGILKCIVTHKLCCKTELVELHELEQNKHGWDETKCVDVQKCIKNKNI